MKEERRLEVTQTFANYQSKLTDIIYNWAKYYQIRMNTKQMIELQNALNSLMEHIYMHGLQQKPTQVKDMRSIYMMQARDEAKKDMAYVD